MDDTQLRAIIETMHSAADYQKRCRSSLEVCSCDLPLSALVWPRRQYDELLRNREETARKLKTSEDNNIKVTQVAGLSASTCLVHLCPPQQLAKGYDNLQKQHDLTKSLAKVYKREAAAFKRQLEE